ncbi:MAG: DEAD/DEAH box helicase [Candidatus Diapherotrites archaeon]
MIEFETPKYSNEDLFKMLNPVLAEWFKKTFGSFTEPQLYAIPSIHLRQNTLVSAETGTGKTLAAFTAILNELIFLSENNQLENKVYCVYISPLRALSNDIERNLNGPLKEIIELAKKHGKKIDVSVAVRTGDTPASKRAAMLRKPPNILILTPESLAIILNAPKFRENLRSVKWCIIDEVHALAENKRGVHLSLSLERLQLLAPEMTRIGLSATVAPLEKVANFLVGMENEKTPRNCKVVDVSFLKKMDLKVISPLPSLIGVSPQQIHEALYETLDSLIQAHKTTLVFTNTRSATERVVHHLKDKFPGRYEGLIGAHHSSLSREHRLNVEERLKRGELRAVVCLEGNTKILTSSGEWKPIKDISETMVQSIGEKLELENNKIKSKSTIVGRQKILKLKTAFGKEISCTPDHKFMTINDSKLEWKEARCLKKNDFVATIRENNFYALSEQELEKLCYDNYPGGGFVKMRPIFLKEMAEKIISKFGTLKDFHDKKIVSPKYSQFRNSLNGKYLMKIENLRTIQREFELKWSNMFENIVKVSSSKYIMPKPLLSKEFLRLLGFMAAEGYISDRALYCSNRNKKLLDYYENLIGNLRGKKPGIKKSSSGTPILMWDSIFLSNFLTNLGFPKGRKARTIKLPEFFFRLDSEKVFSFLSGYFDGDGFVENKDKKRIYAAGFTTTSKQMAENISRLLYREGIMAPVRSRHYDEVQMFNGRKIVKKGWFYELVVLGGEHLRKFAEKINPIRENIALVKSVLHIAGHCNQDIVPNIGKELRKERLAKGLSTYKMQNDGRANPAKYELETRNPTRKQLKNLIDIYGTKNEFLLNLSNSALFWEKIVSIEEGGETETVYNIEVEKNHNYIANGFITQNCSTSLELGIDIGFIDLVVLLSSPKSVARAIQRMGRSGHQLHEKVKGRIIVLDRDDLIECSVLLKNALEKRIDRIQIPSNCLDVLAQQIFGIAIAEQIHIKDLFALVKKSYSFRDLQRTDFNEVVDYLSGEFASLEVRHVYAKIWHDRETGMIGRRGKMARIIYMTNIGTIPDEARIKVKVKDLQIGTIDEGFLERLKKGDVFVLGGNSYVFKYATGMTAQVEVAYKRPPTVPSWFSEMLPLSFDLAAEIQKFRHLMEQKLKAKKSKKEILEFINSFLYVEQKAANAIYEYFREQFLFSEIPHEKKLLIERFEEGARTNIIFHSLYGGRVNDALSRAFGYAISKLMHKDIELSMGDNGFMLSSEHKMPLDTALKAVKSQELRILLERAIDRTEVLGRRFRHCATRSLMILRSYKGKTKSAGRQQMSSRLLINSVRQISPNFCILKEARREVLEDLMDIKSAQKIIEAVEKGGIKVKQIQTDMPSPFALNLAMQGRMDLMRMEERQEFLKRIHEKILKEIRQRESS